MARQTVANIKRAERKEIQDAQREMAREEAREISRALDIAHYIYIP